MKLWRVWFQDGRYKLVRADDTDQVYRSFKKAKREEIVRVDRVFKTSEGVAIRASAAPAARPRGKAGARPRSARSPRRAS